jgi:hypothetical protein
LSCNGSLQRVSRTAFRSRATPGVNRDIGCFGRVAFSWRAVDRIGRKEKFHALHVSGRCAVTHVHVATTDPLRPGRHTDLITHAIVADRCTGGVRAMEEVVARKWRIVPAGVADAVMNGVVPVVTVIGVYSVPAAIMRLKRVMGPANTGISAGNNNVLPGESQRPYLWCMGVIDSGFDCGRCLRWRFFDGARLRQGIVDKRIAFYSRHFWPSCQCLSNLAITLH